jgi:hypothetical protein
LFFELLVFLAGLALPFLPGDGDRRVCGFFAPALRLALGCGLLLAFGLALGGRLAFAFDFLLVGL